MLLLENSIWTKVRIQKIIDFQFLDVRVQWKFHAFKEKRRKGVIGPLSVHIQ